MAAAAGVQRGQRPCRGARCAAFATCPIPHLIRADLIVLLNSHFLRCISVVSNRIEKGSAVRWLLATEFDVHKEFTFFLAGDIWKCISRQGPGWNSKHYVRRLLRHQDDSGCAVFLPREFSGVSSL